MIFFEINNPGLFFVCVLIFFAAVFLRYLISAGIFYWYYYRLKSEKFSNKRLSKRGFRKGQLKKEIYWSMWSSVIFGFFGALTYFLWQKGFTAIYLELDKFGLWYLPVSFILLSLLHETYYYWVHRWMHNPKVFRKIHKVHHDSLVPSPWTAFSFHPWESLLEAIVVPVILLFLPVHPIVIGVYLIFMTLSSVINHLDIEIYPKAFMKSRFGKMFIGATHHHFHHAEFKTNFGLYFTFWDRWMNTESNSKISSE